MLFLVLFNRYKVFFVLGIIIILVQFFLAYKSVTIPLINSIDKGLKQPFPNEETNHLEKDEESSRLKKNELIVSKLGFHPECDITNDKEVRETDAFKSPNFNFLFRSFQL